MPNITGTTVLQRHGVSTGLASLQSSNVMCERPLLRAQPWCCLSVVACASGKSCAACSALCCFAVPLLVLQSWLVVGCMLLLVQFGSLRCSSADTFRAGCAGQDAAYLMQGHTNSTKHLHPSHSTSASWPSQLRCRVSVARSHQQYQTLAPITPLPRLWCNGHSRPCRPSHRHIRVSVSCWPQTQEAQARESSQTADCIDHLEQERPQQKGKHGR